VNTVMNLRVPLNAGKFLSGCTVGGSSRMAELRKYEVNVPGFLHNKFKIALDLRISGR
jgi:hypothetical protein